MSRERTLLEDIRQTLAETMAVMDLADEAVWRLQELSDGDSDLEALRGRMKDKVEKMGNILKATAHLVKD